MPSATEFNKWKQLADIPNQAGFKFVGLTREGFEEICYVIKRFDGTHTLENDMFPRIRLWRALTDREVKREI